jgi:hypothetical protein
VASFDRYTEAERAVDFLADRRFPVERVSIVGRDLEYVEQITGRMTYGRAALNGALTGALIGSWSAGSSACSTGPTRSCRPFGSRSTDSGSAPRSER